MIAAGYFGYERLDLPPSQHGAAHKGVHAPGDTLHFAANAPQLDYVRVATVEAYPVPLADPLNARIAYDENRTARISSPISGRVLRIMTEEGKPVQKGDPLLEIASPDYAQAVADSRKAQADLEFKEQAARRAKILFEGNVLARKDLEAAKDDLLQAEAEAARARQRLGNLGATGLSAGDAFILRAPISGVVSARQVNPGSEVRPDSPPLFVITDPQHLWVLVDLPESELAKVKTGQKVMVEIGAYPGEQFPAQIRLISDVLDPATRRFQVRCDVDNRGGKLKPEMFARVTPVGDAGTKLPRIPNSALITQGIHSYSFVRTAPGVFQRRRIVTAMQGREYSYVKSGLHAGESVVMSGALLLNSELSDSE